MASQNDKNGIVGEASQSEQGKIPAAATSLDSIYGQDHTGTPYGKGLGKGSSTRKQTITADECTDDKIEIVGKVASQSDTNGDPTANRNDKNGIVDMKAKGRPEASQNNEIEIGAKASQSDKSCKDQAKASQAGTIEIPENSCSKKDKAKASQAGTIEIPDISCSDEQFAEYVNKVLQQTAAFTQKMQEGLDADDKASKMCTF